MEDLSLLFREQMARIEINGRALHKILQRRDVAVSYVTVSRWVSGAQTPRGPRLLVLLDALAIYGPRRDRVFELVALEPTT